MCGGGVSLHLCAVGIGSAVHLPGASVIDAARDVATSFARALSELPAEKVRTCWAALAKAFPSDNTDHATLLLEAKANRDRLFPGGAMPEPTETEAEAQADAEAEAEEGGVHEADMDEPEGAEPTAEEYNAFFDAIMAMP